MYNKEVDHVSVTWKASSAGNNQGNAKVANFSAQYPAEMVRTDNFEEVGIDGRRKAAGRGITL
jgi:hypothetical protein